MAVYLPSCRSNRYNMNLITHCYKIAHPHFSTLILSSSDICFFCSVAFDAGPFLCCVTHTCPLPFVAQHSPTFSPPFHPLQLLRINTPIIHIILVCLFPPLYNLAPPNVCAFSAILFHFPRSRYCKMLSLSLPLRAVLLEWM